MPTRSRRFTTHDRELARWAKALAHPARLTILRFLAQRDSCYCGRIVEELPLAQSTVSQHLHELKKAGLIRGTVEGLKVCYCLNSSTIRRMRSVLADYLATLEDAAPREEGSCAPETKRRKRPSPRMSKKTNIKRSPSS